MKMSFFVARENNPVRLGAEIFRSLRKVKIFHRLQNSKGTRVCDPDRLFRAQVDEKLIGKSNAHPPFVDLRVPCILKGGSIVHEGKSSVRYAF